MNTSLRNVNSGINHKQSFTVRSQRCSIEAVNHCFKSPRVSHKQIFLECKSIQRRTGKTPKSSKPECQLFTKAEPVKMQNKTAKLIMTRGKQTELLFNRYEGISLRNNTPQEPPKTKIDSRTVIEIVPFKLDPIQDNPKGEERSSPDKGKSARYFRNSNVIVASACLCSRDFERKEKWKCFTSRNENLSPKVCVREAPKKNFRKASKAKISKEENARRHLVRSYLNGLYAKIMVKVKSQVRDRRHKVKILHNRL
eukprot:TRINITY_DN1561_c0_g4_i1.p1 TRINITY_DN1561_c0_g4~~TRINITY_DN1561_c0_g4_i1.p1  ORF type:complete len:254 (+),score=44.62 TRINITY_DN1561_c0_g4_i1:348-1109(+)